MHERDLRVLAEGGFSALPASDLGEVADWCWSRCLETGDARFCVLSIAFRDLHQWWRERDELGGIPLSAAQRIEDEIVSRLSAVIDASTAAQATVAANELRMTLVACIRDAERAVY